MVVHWLRHCAEAGWRARLLANGIGALATGVITLVIAVAKCDCGVWVVVMLIPALVLVLLGISGSYHWPRLVRVPASPSLTEDAVFRPIFSHQDVRRLDRAARRTHPASERTWRRVLQQELDYAARIAPEIRIVRVVTDRHEAGADRTAWDADLHAPRRGRGRRKTAMLVLWLVSRHCWQHP